MRERKRAGSKSGKASESVAATFTLTGLDQVKALADPLRVRMLGEFADERTTRQVAESMNEKPTRLYHHVDALEKAGLIRMTRTRRNRGTLERYYRAVACSFRADPSLFSPSGTPGGTTSLRRVVTGMLDQTSAELGELIASGHGQRGVQEEGIVCFLEMRMSPGDVRKVRARIDRLVMRLKDVGEPHSKRAASTERRFRLALTFFPLDLER